MSSFNYKLRYYRLFLYYSLSVSRCVTSRFETLINMCVEVLHDVMDLAEDDVIFE